MGSIASAPLVALIMVPHVLGARFSSFPVTRRRGPCAATRERRISRSWLAIACPGIALLQMVTAGDAEFRSGSGQR